MDGMREKSVLESLAYLDFEEIFASTIKPDPVYSNEVDNMLSNDYFGSNGVLQTPNDVLDVQKSSVFKMKSTAAEFLMNVTLNINESGSFAHDLFYRHSMTMTIVYCVAYFVVFALGLIGNFFVVAVVFRSPRMRTVTNYFIVNLAVADILVVVFCLPATLMSNIFVREYLDICNFFVFIFY